MMDFPRIEDTKEAIFSHWLERSQKSRESELLESGVQGISYKLVETLTLSPATF